LTIKYVVPGRWVGRPAGGRMGYNLTSRCIARSRCPEEDTMSDTTKLWDDGHVLEVDAGLKAGAKNPNGPWEIKKVTMKVDVTGMTRKDVVADLMASWRIKRQRCRESMTRDAAYETMKQVVSWKDVGKVATTPVDINAAYHAKFAAMSEEEQEEHIAKLTAMTKAGFGK